MNAGWRPAHQRTATLRATATRQRHGHIAAPASSFAEGRRLTKGYYIDFIGNFDRSAKEGFPLYRITGGPGFIWVASFDQKGRGTLRLVAVDTSAFYPELVANPLPSETRDISPTAAARPNADADIALQRAEKSAEEAKTESKVAREEAETA